MFLKQIELQGFKSFADKTIIRFDSEVTGIVGPNGCGKSNVNDAIRWVLGEQSAKSLRSGSGMSDIIFSGSSERKPVNLAKVSLVFDNTRRIFDIDYDEVEITRSLSRLNHEAGYFINKTPCRLKDISDLVMDTGLGKDSLSIITQGNISSFADAKPEERRLLFEEAAGVAKYKKRKKVSLSKLENTQANLDRLQDIIDELAGRLVPLEKQAKKAREFLNLKQTLAGIEISVLAEEIYQQQEKLKQIQEQIAFDSSEKQRASDQLDLLEEENQQIRKRMFALDGEINSLQNQYNEKMNAAYTLEKQKAVLDEKRRYALEQAGQEEKAAKMEHMVKTARYEYEDRKKRLDALRQQAEQLQQKSSQAEQQEMQLDDESRQAQNVLYQLGSRRQSLERSLSSPYAHQSGMQAVLRAAKSLGGIEGAISDLMEIENEYAPAISAALASSMYQIVTADEKAARNAIGFLKRNNAGRATFVPLNIVKPRYPNKNAVSIASNSEGFIAWASDLVKTQPKYNDLKMNLLGNILVCDDLKHANSMARMLGYSVKIVTLDGDIVHAGGRMSGGSTKNQSSPILMRQQLSELDSQILRQKKAVELLSLQSADAAQQAKEAKSAWMSAQIEVGKLENIVSVKKEKFENLYGQYRQLAGARNLDLEESVEDELLQKISLAHQEMDALQANMRTARSQRLELGEKSEDIENRMRALRRSISALSGSLQKNEIARVECTGKSENALMRLNTEYQMTYEYALEQKKDLNMEDARDQVSTLRRQMQALGNVNLEAPQEYEEVSERHAFLESQKQDLLDASEQIKASISEMDETMKTQFSEMFEKINYELQDVFQAMFGGGSAKLILCDPSDLLNTGVDIAVQPPGKTVKNLQTFSGGEKALIAISVLFSILKARTMPLCIFDEVEAALDQANVERFAKYLKNFKSDSQFIVVTHRPGTMEQCDALYGVTMAQTGVSQVLKVLLKDAVKISHDGGEA